MNPIKCKIGLDCCVYHQHTYRLCVKKPFSRYVFNVHECNKNTYRVTCFIYSYWVLCITYSIMGGSFTIWRPFIPEPEVRLSAASPPNTYQPISGPPPSHAHLIRRPAAQGPWETGLKGALPEGRRHTTCSQGRKGQCDPIMRTSLVA